MHRNCGVFIEKWKDDSHDLTFAMALDINEITTCNITTNSAKGRAIMNTKTLIWDEFSMASKLAFNAVDKLSRDLHKIDEPFGGLIVVLSAVTSDRHCPLLGLVQGLRSLKIQ